MYTLIVVLHVIVSVALILVILLQTGKGSDIGAVFGGGSSQTLFGSTGPTSFLSKLTAGAAIVSNPHAGIEQWFEPGSELLVVEDADAAVETYHSLLDDPGQAATMGAHARERVLDEHTYAHRAQQLLDLVGLGRPATTHA